jgi:protein phosphatase
MMRSIDREIKQGAIDDPDCEDMGTTLSAIVSAEENAYLAHVGDSRIYRLRNGHLEQLTNDNTFVQEMIDEGELTEEEALFHPLRSMLTRALGTSQPLEGVEIASVNIVDGDCFLLCSDGLHGLVSSRTIEVALLRHSLPEKAARTLLQTALDKGGNDNITIIVIHI